MLLEIRPFRAVKPLSSSLSKQTGSFCSRSEVLIIMFSSYADFQISSGIAGDAAAEANAVFVGE